MSSKTPAISIITPVWNGLPYIKECVESVFAQKFQDWEYIISDNGSTDGTREYLDTLSDPRLQIFKQEKNLGIDGNLNFLFTKAKAPVAYFLCADDYFYTGSLERVMQEWSMVPPNTAFIGFNWKEVIKHSEFASHSYKILPKKLEAPTSLLAFFVFGNLPGNLSNVSCNVEMLKASGGFNESLKMAGDFDIWARLARKHTIILSDEETAFVRRHKGTATNYLGKQNLLLGEHNYIYEKLIDELSPFCDRKKLIAFYNIDICSYHLRNALKYASRGRFEGLKAFLKLKSPIFWPKGLQVIGCLPFALSETLRFPASQMLAKNILKQNDKVSHAQI